jgi:hypothetical protein
MAGLSFRGLQMMEQTEHNWRRSSMERVAEALHLPSNGIDLLINRFIEQPEDSVMIASIAVVRDGFRAWPLHLFNFVDAFRKQPRHALVEFPPVPEADRRIRCLFTSTVEAICPEVRIPTPEWCRGIGGLDEPWFVSGIESMKAMALVESPLPYRARNIFVLGNFLDRAYRPGTTATTETTSSSS